MIKEANFFEFGDGGVTSKFMKIILDENFWPKNTQKYFIDS